MSNTLLLSPLFQKLFVSYNHGNKLHWILKIDELDRLLFNGMYGIEDKMQSGKKSQHFMIALVRAFAKMDILPVLNFFECPEICLNVKWCQIY